MVHFARPNINQSSAIKYLKTTLLYAVKNLKQGLNLVTVICSLSVELLNLSTLFTQAGYMEF